MDEKTRSIFVKCDKNSDEEIDSKMELEIQRRKNEHCNLIND
jgi:hypothetical protein